MSVRTAWNMICANPACGSDDELDIAATIWVRLVEDGTDADEASCHDHEWTDTSQCCCHSCGWAGTVSEAEAAYQASLTTRRRKARSKLH